MEKSLIPRIYRERDMKLHPTSIVGRYRLNLNELVLKPIQLPESTQEDLRLEEIRIEYGFGFAIFENFDVTLLPLEYKPRENEYEFSYNGKPHVFTVQASLLGVSPFLDIDMKFDFTKLGDSQIQEATKI